MGRPLVPKTSAAGARNVVFMAVRPDDRMVPVELVEDDVVVGPSPRSRAPRPALADGQVDEPVVGRPHGALVRWAVAGIVLGAIGVVSLATTRGATDAPYGSTVLAEPLHEQWATPADEVLAVHEGLVIVQSTGTRHPRVRALEEPTGREVWSAPLGSGEEPDTCEGLTTQPLAVWCWRDPHWDLDVESGLRTLSPQALVALDLATGAVVTEHEVVDPAVGWAVVGDEVLLAVFDDARLRLTLGSPGDGAPVWSTTIPVPPEGRGPRHPTWVEAVDGLVVIHGATTAVVDAADGSTLATWTATAAEEGTILDGAEVAVTPTGFASWSRAADSVRLPSGVWHDRSGRVVGTFTGELIEPESNDGSVPEAILVTPDDGETLVAMSPARGAELWRIPIAGGAVVARENGTVVVAAGDAVTSYELLTGIRIWARPVDGLHPEITGVSDGGTVVVTAVRSRRWTALAYRLDDGGLLWSGDVPGSGEIGLIPSPPAIEMVAQTPVVWMGRTLIWVD